MAVFMVFAVEARWAGAADLRESIPECPQWVAKADKFLVDCKTHARHSMRTFYSTGGNRGEKEDNSVWFLPESFGSHFFMGCQLFGSGDLSFLGIYYTAVPPAIAESNTAPLLTVGFNGEAVVEVGGHPVAFTPVRPFDTGTVRTRWHGAPDLNCAAPLSDDGYYHNSGSSERAMWIDFSRFDSDHVLTWGFDSYRETAQYIEFFSSGRPRSSLSYGPAMNLIIGASGDIYVKKQNFEHACASGNPERRSHSPLLIHQLCDMRNN